mgnify:CR=1 FL=1
MLSPDARGGRRTLRLHAEVTTAARRIAGALATLDSYPVPAPRQRARWACEVQRAQNRVCIVPSPQKRRELPRPVLRQTRPSSDTALRGHSALGSLGHLHVPEKPGRVHLFDQRGEEPV